MDVEADFFDSAFITADGTVSHFFRVASSSVRLARSFVLKILLMVSVNCCSSTASKVLMDGDMFIDEFNARKCVFYEMSELTSGLKVTWTH